MSVVEVQLAIPTAELVFGQILRDGDDAVVNLTQLVPIDDTFVPYFWVETADPSSFEASVRADEHVASLNRINEVPGTYLYSIEWATEPESLFHALRTHDLVVLEATGTAGEWCFTLLGPDRGNLSSFRTALGEAGISSTVLSVRDPSVTGHERYGLTEKQREALALAYHEGYFDVPAGTSLAALGAHVDITRQSFSRRLKRGTHALLENTFVEDG
jgi:predicted DNA binding protein